MNENETMMTMTEVDTIETIDDAECSGSGMGLIKVVGGALLVAAGAAICKKLKNKNNGKPRKRLKLMWVVDEEVVAEEEVIDELVEEEVIEEESSEE